MHEWVLGSDVGAARSLVKAIENLDRSLPGQIAQFAERIFPENPEVAMASLSSMIAMTLTRKDLTEQAIMKHLPPQVVKSLMLKLDVLFSADFESGSTPFCLAALYMKNLGPELAGAFPVKAVEAAIYSFLLARAIMSRMSPRTLPAREAKCLKKWIVCPEDTADEDLFAAMADKITQLAPDVIFYYQVLSTFNYRQLSSRGKGYIERPLLRMKELFPDDPFSFLELAKLHWSRRAYRKSQQVLEEAWKKAPYDPKVREAYGLGLLRAAVLSRKRRAFAKVRKDLEDALGLNVRSLMPLTWAIRASMILVEEEDEDRAIESFAEISDLALRFRSLLYFDLDLAGMGTEVSPFRTRVEQSLQAGLKKELKGMKSSDLAEIIAPLSPDFEYLLGVFEPQDIFGPVLPKIIEKLDDQQALGLYASLLKEPTDKSVARMVRKDIKARLKKSRGSLHFRFYEALIDYLMDPDVGSLPFYKLVKDLEPEEMQKLRELCGTISSNFHEPLSSALKFFNFPALDDDFWLEPDFDDEDDEWDDDYEEGPWGDSGDDDDEGEWDDDPVEGFLSGFKAIGKDKGLLQFLFEMLVTEATAQGASDEALREMGRLLQRQGQQVINSLRQIYSGKNAGRLSRAGRLILFPDLKD